MAFRKRSVKKESTDAENVQENLSKSKLSEENSTDAKTADGGAKPQKVRKPPSVHAFTRYSLRRASLRWPPRNAVRIKARVARGLYQCNVCNQIHRAKDIVVDHIVPVVGPEGFTTWDSFITRLFVQEDGLQTICVGCHDKKTLAEGTVRTKNRRKKNVKKDI